MSKVSIIYWSGTGNTEIMANSIAEGAKQAGADVKISKVADAAPDFITSDVIVLGCPSMGSEVLEESEMEPFMAMLEPNLAGKKVALFGSYDWGDGQWMRDWQDRIKAAGATLMEDGLTINMTPDGDGMAKCQEYGKRIAAF
ncbi:flavodoxin short chain [Elusimicrobium simillimum]|uniref:flavodoxin n=1 Tax=Elusimicrobium simillimum TaxID=3143438 RepID=UPI003C6FF5C2